MSAAPDRANAAATFPGLVAGAKQMPMPSRQFAHDVEGYTFDGIFLEGRRLIRPTLRACWGQR